MNRAIFLLLQFVFAGALMSQENADLTAEKEAIKAVIESETNYWKDRDYEGWAGTWLHAPHILWLSVGAVNQIKYSGWDSLSVAIKKMIGENNAPLTFKVERSYRSISILGKGAWVVFDQKFIPESGEGSNTLELRMLEKENGKWKLAFMGDINTDSYEDSGTEYVMNYVGYKLLGQKKIDEAIEVFKLNTKLYPESSNVYDSLAEAYMTRGDNELARENYRKSLKLNPQNTNATKMLEKLGRK